MKKLNFFIPIIGIIFFASCSGGENKKTADSLIAKVELKKTKFDYSIAKDFDLKGDIVAGESWTDASGENIMFFCEERIINEDVKEGISTSNTFLYAIHYQKNGQEYKLVSEFKDFEKDCIFDNRARFMEKSIDITDLDADETAEITFVYRLGCSSELSSDGLKLVMLDKANKFTISGNTLVDLNANGSEMMGGETKIEDNFKNAPAQFLENAKKIWEKQKIHDSYIGLRPYLLEKLKTYITSSFSGNEPFWSVKIYEDRLSYSSPATDGKEIFYKITDISEIPGMFMINSENTTDKSTIQMTIKNENCDDGMSPEKHTLKVILNYNGMQMEGCGDL